MLKFLFLSLIFVMSLPISNASHVIQNRLNLLANTENFSISPFPILQWCSFIKIYTLFPSRAKRKNFNTGYVTEMGYFSHGSRRNSQISLISEKNDILISKIIENAICENLGPATLDDNFSYLKGKPASLHFEESSTLVKQKYSRSVSDPLGNEKKLVCTPELSSCLRKLLFKYRGKKESSKIFGILINQIYSDLETMKISSFNNHIYNIVIFFEFAVQNNLDIDIPKFIKLYFQNRRHTNPFQDFQKTSEKSNFEKNPENTLIGEIKNEMPNESKIKKSLNEDTKPTYENISSTLVGQSIDPNIDLTIKHLSHFMDSLFFLFRNIFDCALNENASLNCDDSLACLRLFADCNLLIHIFLLLIHSKTSFTFDYFLFNFEGSVKGIINYFSSLDYTSKLHFLLDDTKRFETLFLANNNLYRVFKYRSNCFLRDSNFFVFFSDSPATLELHCNVPKKIFFENFANALALATIDPIHWEPPELKE